MSKKAESLPLQVSELDEITQVNHQSMQTMMKSYSAWLQGACRVQTEMLRFINKRIHEDIELQMRCVGCDSPADVVEHQMSFAKTMFEDYTEESRRVLDLMAETTHDFTQEADRALADQRPH